MVDVPKVKKKQYRAPCLCGCPSKSPATIAAHGKLFAQRANIKSLSHARAVSGLANSSASRQKQRRSPRLAEEHAAEDQMEVDHLQASGSNDPSPLTRIWAHRASRREREDEDLVSEPGSPEPSEDEDENEIDGNLDPDEPELLSDSEEPRIHAEISATEQLTAGFQLHAARAGVLLANLFPLNVILISCSVQEHLDPGDLDTICAFNYHITKSTTRDAFESLRHTFPTRVQNVQSLYETQRRIAELSGLKPEYSDCCIKICCCFTGSYEKLDRCPFPECQEPRYDKSGNPRMRFQHLPVGPRLQAMFLNKDIIKLLDYRTNHTSRPDHPGSMSDVFDGKLYRELCKKFVQVGDQTFDHRYFEDKHDIALGLSLDGFPIFNKRNLSAWPVILINFSLPPDIRTHLIHLLCYGVIPSPKAVKDIDSFLYPLNCELEKLARGITSLDLRSKEMFLLRAFLILIFGDMPAIAKVMRMKGHNGFCPCCFCEIHGVRSTGSVYYVPLARFDGEESYDAKALEKRTHEQFLNQAEEVITAQTNAEEDRLSMRYGIKGVPLLSLVGTLTLPLSFPLDFMHLIFENLVPNLVAHYTGNFKGLDAGTEEYIFPPHIWSEICETGSASGDTIPSQFGGRVPNLERERSHMTAEAWSFWVMFIAPIILRNRFSKPRYYTHFMKLVHLIHLCLAYDMKTSDIDTI